MSDTTVTENNTFDSYMSQPLLFGGNSESQKWADGSAAANSLGETQQLDSIQMILSNLQEKVDGIATQLRSMQDQVNEPDAEVVNLAKEIRGLKQGMQSESRSLMALVCLECVTCLNTERVESAVSRNLKPIATQMKVSMVLLR